MNYYLIHEIGPTRTTMVTYIFPLGGVILGVLFLHEQLSWQLLAGAVLIVASLAVANWQPKKDLIFMSLRERRGDAAISSNIPTTRLPRRRDSGSRNDIEEIND